MIVWGIMYIVKYFKPKSKKVEKYWNWLLQIYSSLLEMLVVDLAFACFFNLVTDYS
jgi:uncharacterized membrane protein HdeD (DUF308 family)